MDTQPLPQMRSFRPAADFEESGIGRLFHGTITIGHVDFNTGIGSVSTAGFKGRAFE